MRQLITDREKKRLLESKQTGIQWKYYEALKKRVHKNTKENALVQSADTQEWYHLCWERISDAAFLYAMEEEESLGKWLHDRVMEIVQKTQDEWIGPWYRERFPIPEGFLETSHITLAVCEALVNCPSLFSPEETVQCQNSIREKGMLPCMRYCQRILEQRNHINNWFIVILDGFGTAAAVLQDTQMVQYAIECSHTAASLYNCDSYGESVQYANYATIHLSHFFEVLIRFHLASAEELPLQSYADLLPWYVSGFLYCKPFKQGGENYPRTINFGDSAAIFRPSADVLMQIAVRMKEQNPTVAGLATWLFEQTYEYPQEGPDELASFGIYNQFQYLTILMLPDAAAALSPQEADLPLSMRFSGGQVIARDRWTDAKTVVALQAGYEPYHVTSHRHKDQNSFQLVIGKERMLIDPGHCCYRLQAQKEAVSEMSHNTFTLKKNGVVMEQKAVDGNIFEQKQAGNRLLKNIFWGDVQIIVSDMAGLYEDGVEQAMRIWILHLPYQMATIDVVRTKEDVTLCTHFSVNNRDAQLKSHIYSDQRLVLRRGGQALKLFQMFSRTDGVECQPKFDFDWSTMHACYHPLANQKGQGKEGSVCRYRWEDQPGKEHIRIHTYVMDTSEEIVHWHVYLMDDRTVRMEDPSQKEWLDIWTDGKQLKLCTASRTTTLSLS